MVQFDVDYLFRLTGGPQGLYDLMRKHNQAEGLNVPAMMMWRRRHSIPHDWQIPVLYVMHKEGHAVFDFMTDDADLAVR